MPNVGFRPKFRADFLLIQSVLLAALAFSSGCGDSKSSGSGTFPNFYTLSKQAAPSVSSTASGREAAAAQGKVFTLPGNFGMPSFLTFPTTYSTTPAEFTTAFSVSQNFIGQVLNDPGPSGPVKSMYVLLGHAQSTIDTINATYSDSAGNATGCTAIPATTSMRTPFFDTATNVPNVTWVDAGKYTCYYSENGAITAFGRQAITSPPATCTDSFEYYVVSGYGRQNQTNTEQVETRGATVSGSSIQKFYYNGCTGDLKLIYAQSTKYVAGVEFSSRTELSGNTTDHSFKIRTNYIDADTTYATHITIAGTGKSAKTTTSVAPVNFVMGYRSDNCGTGASSATCTTGTPVSFCAKNMSTGRDYELDATTSNCSTYDTEYAAISSLDRSDLPGGYFEVSTTSLGL